MRRVLHHLHVLRPAPNRLPWREQLRIVAGMFLGILLSAEICRSGLTPGLIAPMGASAVLLFGLPASPLAQPWALVGGHVVSGLIGVACARWIPDPALAPAVAVALAMGAMMALRCLHPPGGATALYAALGSPALIASGFDFVWGPVLINALMLTGSGWIYHRLTGHHYPVHPFHQPHPPLPKRPD